MDERAVITAHGPFEGLDRFEARPAVVAALREQGRIVAEKRPYVHSVGHCSRCDTVVEPRLSLQWFVKVEPLAKAAGDAVRDGRTTIHPPELAKRYFDWVDNMHDWCISRQLWWGHRIPVWYGPNDKVDVRRPGRGAADRRRAGRRTRTCSTRGSPPRCGRSPRSAGRSETERPGASSTRTSVLVTGYDILFFWVARMMMFGLYAMDGVQPFDHVFLHGLIRDATGKKMSKSRGNVIDPLDWLDRFGADATRFTLARGANPGSGHGDRRGVGGRLAQLRQQAVERHQVRADERRDRGARRCRRGTTLTDADRWILDLTDAVVSEVDELFEDYQFAKLCDALYHFTWDELCDWYLELAKVQIAEGGERADSTRAVLGHVLRHRAAAAAPADPVRHRAAVDHADRRRVAGGRRRGRAATGAAADAGAARRIAGVQKLVTEIRRFRSDQGVKPGQRVPARLSGVDDAGLAALAAAVVVAGPARGAG